MISHEANILHTKYIIKFSVGRTQNFILPEKLYGSAGMSYVHNIIIMKSYTIIWKCLFTEIVDEEVFGFESGF